MLNRLPTITSSRSRADGNPFKAHIDAAQFPLIKGSGARPDSLYAGLGLTGPGGNVVNLTNDRLCAGWAESSPDDVVVVAMSSGSGKTRAGLELAVRVHTMFMVCSGTVGGENLGSGRYGVGDTYPRTLGAIAEAALWGAGVCACPFDVPEATQWDPGHQSQAGFDVSAQVISPYHGTG